VLVIIRKVRLIFAFSVSIQNQLGLDAYSEEKMVQTVLISLTNCKGSNVN